MTDCINKVSIIIPCYNQAKFLVETINSVLNQTYDNIEIVIVDDCSTDNSKDIINDYLLKYKNIKFYQNKTNKGVIYSRNFAIENCEGEYILPLDGDDLIEPTYIQKAVEILNKNKNIGIVYCKADFIGAKNGLWNLPLYDKKNIIYENCIFNSALFRKTDFIKAGKYKPEMEKFGSEDWDLWLSIIELGCEVYRIDEVLFHYRKHNLSSRTQNCYIKNQNDAIDMLKFRIMNHPKLFVESRWFEENILCDVKNLKNKYKKYKFLFNLAVCLAILEFLMFVFVFFGVIL